MINSLKVTLPKMKNKSDRVKAQAMVEFALILPIALMLIFVVIEIARMAQAYLVIVNSARVGLRYAVTGAFEPEFCTSAIDFNGNDLICAMEPDKDARTLEIDAARLLSIYDLTEDSAIGIMKDLTVTDQDTPGYFNVTVCSSNDDRVYHPPPEDYCEPDDHPGDPSTEAARVLVAVTFEHPVILPIVSSIAPSVTLHSERTGIVEQFRVARVLGLPPVIEVPTATPGPTSTATPIEPIDCTDYTFSDFGITHDNHVVVNINNYDDGDVTIELFEMTWQSAYLWAIATGYFDIELDWFEWDGGNRFQLDDLDSPTIAGVSRLLPGGFSNTWETDFDWGGEVEWVFVNDFGLTPQNFGFRVVLTNGNEVCEITSPEVLLPPPTPNCDLYSCGDFSFQSWAQVDVELFNGDEMSTLITGIDYNWDYAEAYGELVGSGSEDLNMDFMYYAGQYIWGEGNGYTRDWNSTTNTAADSPWTFPGGWSPSFPPFDANSSSTLRVDFDNDWSTWYTDLLPTDFGVTVSFLNGCTLTCAPVERPLPQPNCDLYYIQDFEIRGNNAVRTYLTNDDILSTNIERIVLDWDYAEALSDFIVGPNILYADDFIWEWDYIWSGNNDGIGDLSSVTDTSVDSPDAFHSNNTDFDAGDTVRFEADFEYAVGYDPDGAFWSWGLRPQDFGVTFYFENGCELVLTPEPRVLATPTPDCDDIYAADVLLYDDDFRILVRNNNVAPAYLIDSTLTWPGPACPQGATPGVPYVNYISWDWSSYYGTDTYCSPVNAVPSPPGELPGTSSRWWRTDFNNGLPYGYYQGVLTFEYPDWGICIVEADITIVEPTGTPTTDPNATSTPTRTLRPTETNTPIPSETPIPSITPTDMPTWTPRPTTQPPTLTPTPPVSPTSSANTPTNTPWPTQPGGG